MTSFQCKFYHFSKSQKKLKKRNRSIGKHSLLCLLFPQMALKKFKNYCLFCLFKYIELIFNGLQKILKIF